MAPPPAARALEQAQAKALTDWGHASAAQLASPEPLLPPMRAPLFGGAALAPPPAPATDDSADAPTLFPHELRPRRAGRWLVAAVVVAAMSGVVVVWTGRAPTPAPNAVEPTAAASPVAERPSAPRPVAKEAPPVAAVAPAVAVVAAGPLPPALPPALAGSPQQDAPPALEDPGDADYRASLQAAREANGAARWEVEAEEYRRALSVHPSSLEAKEGLGAAIVKSSGKAGSYLEAERLLADVVTADPARPRAWLVLGMARQLGARPGPAVEAYRRYLALTPQGPTSADVRAVIRELERPGVAQRRPGR